MEKTVRKKSKKEEIIDVYKKAVEDFVQCKNHFTAPCDCWRNANVARSIAMAMQDKRVLHRCT